MQFCTVSIRQWRQWLTLEDFNAANDRFICANSVTRSSRWRTRRSCQSVSQLWWRRGVVGTQERPVVVADFINQALSSPLIAGPVLSSCCCCWWWRWHGNQLAYRLMTSLTQRNDIFVQFHNALVQGRGDGADPPKTRLSKLCME